MAESLVGKYEYHSNENLIEFFKAWKNFPDHVLEKIIPKPGTKREISVDGNKITIVAGKPVTLILNTEVEEVDENNYVSKSTAKLEGNKLIVQSEQVTQPGVFLRRTYSTCEKGLKITFAADNVNVEANIYFSRI